MIKPDNEMGDLKQCNICLEYFPRNKDYFYENKCNHDDGLYPYCKSCCIKKSRAWAIKNLTKEDLKEINKAQNTRPERKQVKRDFDAVRRATGYNKKYYYAHKNSFKIYRQVSYEKRHEISKKEWLFCKEYFNNSCAYCGITIDEHLNIFGQDFHKDHVDNVGKNDLSNCVPACKNCNSRKWKLDFDIWYNVENTVFDNYRYRKIKNWIDEDYKDCLDK
jgi:hypothetical protein